MTERDDSLIDEKTAEGDDSLPPIPDGGLASAMPDWLKQSPNLTVRGNRAQTIDIAALTDGIELPVWLEAVSVRVSTRHAPVVEAAPPVVAVPADKPSPPITQPAQSVPAPSLTQPSPHEQGPTPPAAAYQAPTELTAAPESSDTRWQYVVAGVLIVGLIAVLIWYLGFS